MGLKVMAQDVRNCGYLEANTVYDATWLSHETISGLFTIKLDNGMECICRLSGCAHIDFADWTIVEDTE